VPLDLVLRRARLSNHQPYVDIGVAHGRIIAVSPVLETSAPTLDVLGRLVFPGFVETHLHLDKSCLTERCPCSQPTLEEAIAEVAAAKREFTEDDVFQRAERTLLMAIRHGTNRIRTHVEVDPRIGLRSFTAIRELKFRYARLVDIQICVFPQEGLLNDPGTEQLLEEACQRGADLIGGCPYTDTDPKGQIAKVFALATQYDLDIDFHLDFDLNPEGSLLADVCEMVDRHRWGGRVAVGHVTKLSSLNENALTCAGIRLAQAGVAVTALPATDLFLMGRNYFANKPRGVAPLHQLLRMGVQCSIASNNVLNPFTPYGDCSLIRAANLYANVAQLAAPSDLHACFDMVSESAARLMNLGDYGVAPGMPAHLVVLESRTPAAAVAELAQPLLGLRAGELAFTRPRGAIYAEPSVGPAGLGFLFRDLAGTS
jgi:cytosine/creatinine deaminase